jgi:hypothetical protein
MGYLLFVLVEKKASYKTGGAREGTLRTTETIGRLTACVVRV